MDEKKLGVYIGSKIKEFRTRKKLTQGKLGKMVGVQNNTISAYERGVISTDQDILFKLSDALDVSIDDFFPPNEQKNNELERALKMTDGLEIKDMEFLNKLIEKTLTLEGEERSKFLESIKFTVDYYNKMND